MTDAEFLALVVAALEPGQVAAACGRLGVDAAAADLRVKDGLASLARLSWQCSRCYAAFHGRWRRKCPCCGQNEYMSASVARGAVEHVQHNEDRQADLALLERVKRLQVVRAAEAEAKKKSAEFRIANPAERYEAPPAARSSMGVWGSDEPEVRDGG